MTLWGQLQSLPGPEQAQISELFGKYSLELEVQSHLATWLEIQPWGEAIDSNVQEQVQMANELFSSLVDALRQKARDATSLNRTLEAMILINKLNETANNIEVKYQNNATTLANIMNQLLMTEAQMISQHQLDGMEGTEDTSQHQDFVAGQLAQNSQEMEQVVKTLEQQKENYVIKFEEIRNKIVILESKFKETESNPSLPQKTKDEQLGQYKNDMEKMWSSVKEMAEGLLGKRNEAIDKLKFQLEQFQAFQKEVLDGIVNWKYNQKLHHCGFSEPGPLDELKKHCESLAELEWRGYTHTMQVENLFLQVLQNNKAELNRMTDIKNAYKSLLTDLIQGAFLIEKQPPQVLKTQTKFTSTVRHLIGNKLNIQMSKPDVTATIITTMLHVYMSEDLHWLVVIYRFQNNIHPSDIARMLHLSLSTVKRIIARFNLINWFCLKDENGSPPISMLLTRSQMLILFEYILSKEMTYLKEMTHELNDVTGSLLTIQSMQYLLKRFGYSRKKIFAYLKTGLLQLVSSVKESSGRLPEDSFTDETSCSRPVLREKQAEELHRTGTWKSQGQDEILNNKKVMEYNQEKDCVVAEFKNMSLKKINRQGKKTTERVMDEKSTLLFQAQLHIGGEKFSVMQLSLPVSVIVHGNQQPEAEGTIFWDNAFSQIERSPFVVCDLVSWQEFTVALNARWALANVLHLNENHLNYLASKLYGDRPMDGYNNHSLKKEAFNKDNLPDRSFTFWNWFYHVMDLVKKNLHQEWQEGLVTGFIGKDEARDWLLQKPVGTFLLRFSDGILGGISIAYVIMDQGTLDVWNIEPWSNKDLGRRNLPDRIKDLKELQYLYPDTPKDDAFGGSYSKKEEPQRYHQGDYVPSDLKCQVPRTPSHISQGGTMDSPLPMGSPDSLMHDPLTNETLSSNNQTLDPEEAIDFSSIFQDFQGIEHTFTVLDFNNYIEQVLDNFNGIQLIEAVSSASD